MKKLLLIISLVLTCSNTFSQQRDIISLLDQTLRYRGLTLEDISIPIEFFSTAEKNPTNEVKLTFPLVKEMMANPLRSMTWLDSLIYVDNITFLNYVYLTLLNVTLPAEKAVYNFPGLENLGEYLNKFAKNNNSKNKFGKFFSHEDKKFLNENIKSIFEESDASDDSGFDVFIYNKLRDSAIHTSKATMDILSKMDADKILGDAYSYYQFCEALYLHFLTLDKKNKYTEYYNNKFVQGDYYYYSDEDGIRIAIGGPGRNIYTGKFDFIIDLGGDDVYNIERHTPPTAPLSRGELSLGGFSCIIDLAGNDYYTTSSDFALAGGLFSSSFIFDKEGDDYYESKGTGNLGAAIGGIGLLYDEKGNDTYKGISFSIGAGCFGVGLLIDREGNDFYIANSYSQGFGMTEGVGAIIDNKGNDSYLVDARSLDIGRYNDHYVSMCQGYGLGLRPYYAGGIGLIIEGEGNDIYNTDIFGQGGAYWYSLGAIVDKGGHDKYNGYQYSQGAGIHLAVGLLKDYDGWDFYQSNGVSQGCGHDFGFGMLWDVKGNDNYSAYSLSQGAGNANGIGILLDESGTDGYLNKFPDNTRGYGNPRREYGSIGVFLDASGKDYYSQSGYDSTIMNSFAWGVFTDFDNKDLPEQLSGDNFKVPVDSSDMNDTVKINGRDPLLGLGLFTTDEYFIMAKTIEPRFSLWQEFGFRKLVEDSTKTANYIVSKFATTDHRDVQVFRVLSQKIQWSIAQVLLEKFKLYTTGAGVFVQAELSMMCYIFGETKDPSAKDYLLQLTYDENYRLRSSAINALGKINYDKSDNEFIAKVTERLNKLASEKSTKKLYNKDIAFALGNYISPLGLQTLLELLNNTFYGVRFVAAENLRKYPDLVNSVFENNTVREYLMNETSLIAFTQAMTQLNSNDFKVMFTYLTVSPAYNNEAVIYNLMHLLKFKIDSADEKGIDIWYQNELEKLQLKVSLKVK